jgi:uncharacterized cupin superfamily protein
MSATKPPVALNASDVAPRPKPSTYPAPFAPLVSGREKRPLGEAFGLTNFGVNLVRMAPGAISALRHAHARQDEFVYVLAGRPVLVTDAGETQLAPGMCAGFPCGTGDAHHLINRTAEEAVYLEVGDRTPGDSVTYPEHDLRAEFGADGKWRYLHRDGTPWQT